MDTNDQQFHHPQSTPITEESLPATSSEHSQSINRFSIKSEPFNFSVPALPPWRRFQFEIPSRVQEISKKSYVTNKKQQKHVTFELIQSDFRKLNVYRNRYALYRRQYLKRTAQFMIYHYMLNQNDKHLYYHVVDY